MNRPRGSRLGAPGKDVIAFIIDKIEDWIRGLLTDSIVDSLTGLFDSVNDKVGSIAGDVGATPQAKVNQISLK